MTTENNKIIAEFIGWKEQEEDFMFNPKTSGSIYVKSLLFHKDWNWLMEVVEKIESIDDCGIDIFFGCVEIYKDGITIIKVSAKHKNKIEAVYNACVEFIKWYNENGAKNN